MNIGIVTTWMERGAAYVSKIYMDLLVNAGHQVFIFARGGEAIPDKSEEKWNESYVTRSSKYMDTTIEMKRFCAWVKKNEITTVFFNEQQDIRVLIELKHKYPEIKTGAYVDYYTETTIPFFSLYDFIICNTKRHLQTFANHPQKYYLPWGTNLEIFKPGLQKHDIVTFFHSVGMSKRKGTDILTDAFIEGELYKKSRLVIHTQVPIETVCRYSKKELEKYGVDVIEKTVTAPGLYNMGDVYVYPSKLDGLGLTMYEALASGLPLIVPDFPPMNEIGNSECVTKISIKDYYCRSDAYYYPMVICDKDELIRAMSKYIDNPEELHMQQQAARIFAVEHYDISRRSVELSKIFCDSIILQLDPQIEKKIKKNYTVNWAPVKRIMNLRFVNNIRSTI